MALWFRSWHGAPTDNKWLVIARRAAVLPGVVSAVAWVLMDHASQADDRGSIAGFDIETYCAFSGFSEHDVTAIIAAPRDKAVIGPDDRLTACISRRAFESLGAAVEGKPQSFGLDNHASFVDIGRPDGPRVALRALHAGLVELIQCRPSFHGASDCRTDKAGHPG